MIEILVTLLFNFALAVTIQNNCQQLNISLNEIKYKKIDQDKCVENYIKNKMDKTSFIFNGKNEEYFIINKRMEEIDFCKFPSETIARINLKEKEDKILWSSLKNFKKTLLEVSTSNVLVRDIIKSRQLSQNICEPFPAFSRAKKFNKKHFPTLLKNFTQDGYMLFSSKVSAIFFLNSKLDTIEYTMIFPGNIIINDAEFLDNGTLVTLSSDKGTSTNRESCLQSWDIGTGTLISNLCKIKKPDEQILLNIEGRIMHVFSETAVIGLEILDPNGFVTVNSILSPANFSLRNSFIVE